MTEIKNENIEFNFDLPNINDILDEKVQINTIFHFGLVQNVLEEFIKRQNSMYQKINSLEVKFDSWSLTHDINVDTDNINKIEIKRDSINREETENEKDENNENKEINNINNEEIEGKFKEINKKIKKLEMINKELAQRIVVNNNENSEKMTNFIETSEDKIKQLNSNFKNVESKVKEKERVINNQTNKMNQLLKKMELIETTTEENTKKIKTMSTDLFNLQRLKMEDLVNEFYSYKSKNDKSIKDLKKLIEENDKFKNNLSLNNPQDPNNPNGNVNVISAVDESHLKEMASELKNYINKNISETNKLLKKSIDDLNISKINQDISNIQKELKDKLTQKSLTNMNIRLEDFETKIIEFNSQISDFKQTFDHHKEHIGKIDKNFEFLSMQMNTLIQKETQKEKKSNDFLSDEGIKLFVKKDLYEEDMTKILKKIEKIFLFQQEYLAKITSVEKRMKLFITDKEIKNIEHYTLNMIQEFKINAIKKFMDKKEAMKSFKLIGLQIQNINEYLNLSNNNTISYDRVLINNTKGGYFCPSCDNKLSANQSLNQSNEYVANKKKEKHGGISYRMGQGFSHMLQLINSDLMKSAEKINDDLSMKVDDNNNNDITHDKSYLDNKSLPRLNSQKSFTIFNGETKNNELDTTNNNISGHYNENINIFKTLRNNSIDNLVNRKSDIKHKLFRKIEKNMDSRGNNNQIILNKLKK